MKSSHAGCDTIAIQGPKTKETTMRPLFTVLVVLLLLAVVVGFSAASSPNEVYLPLISISGHEASTPTSTETTTATPTSTATATPTATDTVAPSATPTLTPTSTATQTPTATATWTPTATTAPAPQLRIGTIQYSGSNEYIRIDNVGSGSQNLTGWSIQSYRNSDCQPDPAQLYTFPSGYVLAAGASVRVHSGPDATNDPPSSLRWTTNHIWHDGGDRGDLRNASGQIVSTLAYGSCR